MEGGDQTSKQEPNQPEKRVKIAIEGWGMRGEVAEAGLNVYFVLVGMSQSYFLWIGTAPAQLNYLSLAIPSQGSSKRGSASALLARPLNDWGTSLANRLGKSSTKALPRTKRLANAARRTGCMFFVSCNLSQQYNELLLCIERTLLQELKTKHVLV
jgi:hypothetical protein